MRGSWEQLLEVIRRNRGRVSGVLTALFLSWIFLAYGFWRAVIVFVLLVIGYTMGARVDAGLHPLPTAILDFFNERDRWRGR